MDLITNNLVQIEIKCDPSAGCLSLIFPPFISIIMMLKTLCEIPLDTKELIWGIKKKSSCKLNKTKMFASASLRFAFYYLITHEEHKKENAGVHVVSLHKCLKFYTKTSSFISESLKRSILCWLEEFHLRPPQSPSHTQVACLHQGQRTGLVYHKKNEPILLIQKSKFEFKKRLIASIFFLFTKNIFEVLL